MAVKKISELTTFTPPLASDDLFIVNDTSGAESMGIVPGQALLYSKTSLTSAQILALNSTPIQLVAAPGAGKVIVPISIVASYTFVAAAYATNVVLNLIYDTGTGSSFTSSNILDDVTSGIQTYTVTALAQPLIANKKLSITVATGDPVTGDSTLDIYLWYQILTL